jgi:hypothetical protein
MAVRTPLKLATDDLQVMDTADTNAIIARTVYLYFTDPSVTLDIGSNTEGTFTAMIDSRTKAGAAATHVSSFPTEATTAEPSTLNVSWTSLAEETVAGLSTVSDTNNIKFPVYLNASNNIVAMTLQDMYDTFIHTTIDNIISSQPYKSHKFGGTGPAGYTQLAVTPIFFDTRADTSLYTAGGITEALDQPKGISLYQLWQKDAVDSAYTSNPMYIDSDANLRQYSGAEFDVIMKALVRYAAVNLTSHKLRFFINGTGTTCGEAMIDTKLDGSGNYNQRWVNGNDYRAQEFPDGTPQTITTYYLKARKV